MFISFCLIVKYPWFLNQLSLNCGIVPGSGQTNDDVTSLMQICHNNNSNNNNYNNNADKIFQLILGIWLLIHVGIKVDPF